MCLNWLWIYLYSPTLQQYPLHFILCVNLLLTFIREEKRTKMRMAKISLALLHKAAKSAMGLQREEKPVSQKCQGGTVGVGVGLEVT